MDGTIPTGQLPYVLRRIDEAAIFLMIAGSYTPFTVKLLPGEPSLRVAVTVTGTADKR